MKLVKAVRVLYVDDSQEEWKGEGNVREHHTTIRDADGKEIPYFYVEATLRVTDDATE